MTSVLIIRNEDKLAIAYETPYLEDKYEIKWRRHISPFVDNLFEVIHVREDRDNLYLVFEDHVTTLKRWEWCNMEKVIFYIIDLVDVE